MNVSNVHITHNLFSSLVLFRHEKYEHTIHNQIQQEIVQWSLHRLTVKDLTVIVKFSSRLPPDPVSEHQARSRPLAVWGASQSEARFLARFPWAKRFAKGLYGWVIPVTYTTGIYSVLTASPVFALRIALWFVNCHGCKYFTHWTRCLFCWIPNFLLQRLEWMGRTAVSFFVTLGKSTLNSDFLYSLASYACLLFPSFQICFKEKCHVKDLT